MDIQAIYHPLTKQAPYIKKKTVLLSILTQNTNSAKGLENNTINAALTDGVFSITPLRRSYIEAAFSIYVMKMAYNALWVCLFSFAFYTLVVSLRWLN